MPRLKLRRLILILCAGVTVVLSAAAGIASGNSTTLSGYWPMNEGRGQSIRDYSRYGNTGRLGSTQSADSHDAQWVGGLFNIGSALRLDGNDFVAMPETASLRPQRVTVEALVRAPKSPGQFKYVMVKGGDRCEAGSFGLYTSANGGMAFYVNDGKRWHRSPSAAPTMWDNRWHYVAGSFNGKVVRLYVDAREIGHGTAFSGKIDYDLKYRQAYIGAFRGACDLTFTGDVDEVRLWSAALSLKGLSGH